MYINLSTNLLGLNQFLDRKTKTTARYSNIPCSFSRTYLAYYMYNYSLGNSLCDR